MSDLRPLVGREVTFDASTSSDPEAAIVRFAWDLDGDRSFETNGGSSPRITTSYATQGVRIVGLRVVDSEGEEDTANLRVTVQPSRTPPLRATATQAPGRRRVRLAFSGRLRGGPLPGRPGRLVRRGHRLSLTGRAGRGRLLARALDPPGRMTKSERALRRFLTARWRTRLSFRLDRRTRRWSARGLVLARGRRAPGVKACMRVRIGGHPGERSTGRLTLLGGTRRAARLRGSARFRFRLEPQGPATLLGTLSAGSGRPRGLPPACARLA